MKVGDLVKCDDWVYNGRSGVVIEVQTGNHCVGAYVLLDIGIKLIRLENLHNIDKIGESNDC
tara:strand:- start:29596 stop:29781 length:186 start_codon:yes stop_codon:yes gene_type:complete